MTLSEIAAQIESELSRLLVDTEADPYSGISVEVLSDEIRVFDDHADAYLANPEEALGQLQKFRVLGDLESVWGIFARN